MTRNKTKIYNHSHIKTTTMKPIFKSALSLLLIVLVTATSCRDKKKNDPAPNEPTPPANTEEVITTVKLIFTDSASLVQTSYMYKDPDGDGGQAAFYGGTNQSDSVFTLTASTTYSVEILLLDETKNPVDTISKEVKAEGDEHMFFFNNGNNTILNSGNPYTVQLNGSNIMVTYLDLDAGSPQRGIGLKTRFRTYSATGSIKNLLNVVLKHQPGTKNGTYAPGDTDVDVNFKVMVN
jgi:hypothetical protein